MPACFFVVDMLYFFISSSGLFEIKENLKIANKEKSDYNVTSDGEFFIYSGLGAFYLSNMNGRLF